MEQDQQIELLKHPALLLLSLINHLIHQMALNAHIHKHQ